MNDVPKARNPANQRRVQLVDADHKRACEDGHARVAILYRDECAECWGSDAYCFSFCPICSYCGGC